MKTATRIKDEFRGDDARLCRSIKALLDLSDDGTRVPASLAAHARDLLAASYRRLKKRSGAPAPF